jgi:hypothetical protein
MEGFDTKRRPHITPDVFLSRLWNQRMDNRAEEDRKAILVGFLED